MVALKLAAIFLAACRKPAPVCVLCRPASHPPSRVRWLISCSVILFTECIPMSRAFAADFYINFPAALLGKSFLRTASNRFSQGLFGVLALFFGKMTNFSFFHNPTETSGTFIWCSCKILKGITPNLLPVRLCASHAGAALPPVGRDTKKSWEKY